MPRPARSLVTSSATMPPPAIAAPDAVSRAKVAFALGQLGDTLRLLEPVTGQHATPATIDAFTLAAEAALELRDLPTARAYIRRAALESGLPLDDLNVSHPGTDYPAAQLHFDVGILRAQAAWALGAGPEAAWFNQAIYTPDGVFCLVDQKHRRLVALDTGGHILWGKQLATPKPVGQGSFPQQSLILSQRPDEGLSYIDNQYRDFARLNRFAVYQALCPLGERGHTFGSFTQDFFGNLYATSTDGQTIAIFTEDGSPIKEIALADIEVDRPAIPFSILGDDEGHIYLYDTQVLVVLDRYGHPLFKHTLGKSPLGPALGAGLPGGLHLTPDGHLWLVRPHEGKVVMVHPEREAVVRTIGPDLPCGPLVFPVDVLSDWTDNLYIVDAGAGRVVRISKEGQCSVLFERPYWAGIDPSRVQPAARA
ncbi:MAG TPA: hypothetical protein VEI97_01055 [bacterium]|nr:hypothetical protein [bacterium]